MTAPRPAGRFNNSVLIRFGGCCFLALLASAGLPRSAIGLEGMSYPILEGVPLQIAQDDGGTGGGPFPTPNVLGPFNIAVSFNDTPTAGELAAFNAAEATWESIISGYLENVPTATVTIEVNLDPIDGAGGILGSAGPTSAKSSTATYLYTHEGEMTFDTADTASMLSDGSLNTVILHEMGHVLGIGTLWSSSAVGFPGYQELYVNGSGQYTGSFGLAAYNVEFAQLGTSVPVELGGGPGTANGHWNEGDGGAATGITSLITGQDFRFELMTGWLNSPTFISALTKASMVDLGYTIVPEPSSVVLMLLGCVGLLQLRRRGSRARSA